MNESVEATKEQFSLQRIIKEANELRRHNISYKASLKGAFGNNGKKADKRKLKGIYRKW